MDLDTYGLEPGEKYESRIYVLVGAHAACLTLLLSVAQASSAQAPDYSGWSPGGSYPLPKAPPLWFFSWLPWGWQVGLSILGGIVAPGFTAAWSIPALAGRDAFPLVRLIKGLISVVPYFDPAWAMPTVWVPVAATGVLVLGLYSVVATRLLSRLPSCGRPTVIAADLVEVSGVLAGAVLASILAWFLLVGVVFIIVAVVAVILSVLLVALCVIIAFGVISAALNS